jgi:hypothetical protein
MEIVNRPPSPPSEGPRPYRGRSQRGRHELEINQQQVRRSSESSNITPYENSQTSITYRRPGGRGRIVNREGRVAYKGDSIKKEMRKTREIWVPKKKTEITEQNIQQRELFIGTMPILVSVRSSVVTTQATIPAVS